MEVSIDQAGGNVYRIILDGRLDVAGTQAAETEFHAAVKQHTNIIVDLSKVPFIASLGLRLLVAGAQARSKQGGKVVLVSPDDMTRKILKTTGIDQLIPVFNGIDEALTSF